jgi:hypothetical protein
VFSEWASLFRDLRSSRSVREVIGYAFGKPGWAPHGRGKTSARLREENAAPGAVSEAPELSHG